MYRIAICDDDRRFTAELHQKLDQTFSVKGANAIIENFHDTASFLKKINCHITYDLIFLDILLGKENGYHFAKYLRKNEIRSDIVFISSTEEYAVMGYDVSPLLYLVKPVNNTHLTYACDIFLKKHRPNQILLNLPSETLSLNIDELLYCEVFGHRISLHLASGVSREIRYSLNSLEKLLPGHMFIRSHQSYLVNMAHISGITRYELTLSTKETLPISQSRYMGLQNRFIRYAGAANALSLCDPAYCKKIRV